MSLFAMIEKFALPVHQINLAIRCMPFIETLEVEGIEKFNEV